jgi:hypothetical protein
VPVISLITSGIDAQKDVDSRSVVPDHGGLKSFRSTFAVEKDAVITQC